MVDWTNPFVFAAVAVIVYTIMNWIQEKTGYNKWGNKWIERQMNRLFGRNTEKQSKPAQDLKQRDYS